MHAPLIKRATRFPAVPLKASLALQNASFSDRLTNDPRRTNQPNRFKMRLTATFALFLLGLLVIEAVPVAKEPESNIEKAAEELKESDLDKAADDKDRIRKSAFFGATAGLGASPLLAAAAPLISAAISPLSSAAQIARGLNPGLLGRGAWGNSAQLLGGSRILGSRLSPFGLQSGLQSGLQGGLGYNQGLGQLGDGIVSEIVPQTIQNIELQAANQDGLIGNLQSSYYPSSAIGSSYLDPLAQVAGEQMLPYGLSGSQILPGYSSYGDLQSLGSLGLSPLSGVAQSDRIVLRDTDSAQSNVQGVPKTTRSIIDYAPSVSGSQYLQSFPLNDQWQSGIGGIQGSRGLSYLQSGLGDYLDDFNGYQSPYARQYGQVNPVSDCGDSYSARDYVQLGGIVEKIPLSPVGRCISSDIQIEPRMRYMQPYSWNSYLGNSLGRSLRYQLQPSITSALGY